MGNGGGRRERGRRRRRRPMGTSWLRPATSNYPRGDGGPGLAVRRAPHASAAVAPPGSRGCWLRRGDARGEAGGGEAWLARRRRADGHTRCKSATATPSLPHHPAPSQKLDSVAPSRFRLFQDGEAQQHDPQPALPQEVGCWFQRPRARPAPHRLLVSSPGGPTGDAAALRVPPPPPPTTATMRHDGRATIHHHHNHHHHDHHPSRSTAARRGHRPPPPPPLPPPPSPHRSSPRSRTTPGSTRRRRRRCAA